MEPDDKMIRPAVLSSVWDCESGCCLGKVG